jgi:hypothetical protein
LQATSYLLSAFHQAHKHIADIQLHALLLLLLLLLHETTSQLQLKAGSDDLAQMFDSKWGCPFGKSLRYGAALGLIDVSDVCVIDRHRQCP